MWFCVVTTLGERSWQLRAGRQLDSGARPPGGIATLLSTRTLYAGLLWGLATVALSVLLAGCSAAGSVRSGPCTSSSVIWAAAPGTVAQLEMNRFRPAQAIKYYIWSSFSAPASFCLGNGFFRLPADRPFRPAAAGPPLHQLILLPLADRAGLSPAPLPAPMKVPG